jgi:xanthine dehydrogenase accessory factor
VRELADQLDRWRRGGRRFAFGRVVSTEGSAPLPVGATLAVDSSGVVAGSVSGGCIDSAVVDACLGLLSGPGEPTVLRFTDGDPELGVSLVCGGSVDVLIDRRLPQGWSSLLDAWRSSRPVALVTVVDQRATTATSLGASVVAVPTEGGPWRAVGSLGDPALDVDAAAAAGRSQLAHEVCTVSSAAEPGTDVSVLVERFAGRPRLVIAGAAEYAASLARVGRHLGRTVIVCDPRPPFADRSRFPDADAVVCAWPDRYVRSLVPPLGEQDAVCVVTHDSRIDVPTLAAALGSGAGYIGALGSRRTTARRLARLADLGFDGDALGRLHAPVGLDIGATTPAETAVAIAAELIATAAPGPTGRPLAQLGGPIHRRR